MKFLVVDKSGRGFSTAVNLKQLLDGWDDEEDDYDNFLHEWAGTDATVGDVWDVSNTRITRIS